MSITITLDPDMEQAIERKAARMKVSKEEYMVILAGRSTRPKAKRSNSGREVRNGVGSSQDKFQAVINRADPAELKSIGLTLPVNPANTGAELIEKLRAAGVFGEFGDPDVDAPEFARQIREQSQNRNWE